MSVPDPAAVLEALQLLLAPYWPAFGVIDEPALRRHVLDGQFRNPASVALKLGDRRIAGSIAALGFGSAEISVPALDLVKGSCVAEFRELSGLIRGRSQRDGAETRIGLILEAKIESFADAAGYAGSVETAVGQHLADHITVDLSSGHSAGYSSEALAALCDRIVSHAVETREKVDRDTGRRVPILIRIVDDIAAPELDTIVGMAVARRLDGIMVSPVSRMHIEENLVGRPVYGRTTSLLAAVASRIGPGMALVGEGGVDDVETVLGKVSAGADLVIINASVVAMRPLLLSRAKAALLAAVKAGKNVRSVRELVGANMDEWKAREW